MVDVQCVRARMPDCAGSLGDPGCQSQQDGSGDYHPNHTPCRAPSSSRQTQWRASDPALKTGTFFRTKGVPIEIPAASLAAAQGLLIDGGTGVDLAPGVWFPEEVREMTIFAEQYDFAISLLLLENRDRYIPLEEEAQEDTYDRIAGRQPFGSRRKP